MARRQQHLCGSTAIVPTLFYDPFITQADFLR